MRFSVHALGLGFAFSIAFLSSAARADDEPAATTAAPAAVAPAPVAAPSVAPGAAPATSTPAPAERAAEAPQAHDYTVPMMVTDLLLTGAFAASWTSGRAQAISAPAARGAEAIELGAFVGSGVLYHEMFDTRRQTVKSVLVRTLAPAVLSLAGWAGTRNSESSDCKRQGTPEALCDHDKAEVGAVIGAIAGMLGATVIEATMLVPDGRKARPAPKAATGISVMPSLAVQGSGGQAGLVGRF